MNRGHNIQSAQTIRFRRWSNKNFAVFNSLRKVIQIGFLSKIIHGLAAASSYSKPMEWGEQADFNAESASDEWLELDVLKAMELLGLTVASNADTYKKSVVNPESASDFPTYYSNYLRPFRGLLFYISLAATEVPGFLYSKT